jgi:hypothetical protein
MDRFGDVDDGNTVFGAVDEFFHFGVPAFCLMSEMTPGFEQIFYCDRHCKTLFLFSMLFLRLSLFFTA